MVNCPICNDEMEYHNGAYFCMNNVHSDFVDTQLHKVIVLCKCLRRMKPKAKYCNYGKLGWTFWECPHCFNKR